MRELNESELESVSGGVLPYVAAFALGFVTGYVSEKYKQWREEE